MGPSANAAAVEADPFMKVRREMFEESSTDTMCGLAECTGEEKFACPVAYCLGAWREGVGVLLLPMRRADTRRRAMCTTTAELTVLS
jgi:hypothetical protein